MILWVLFSALIGGSRQADYKQCIRDQRGGNDHIKCERVGLNGVPVNFPVTVGRLTIRDDDLSNDFEFPTLPRLTRLTLTNVNIKHIPSRAFANLRNLKELIIAKNNIESIADDAFHGLTRLEQLRLGGNNIEELPDYMLKDSPHMRIIYLNNNKLRKISANLFNPLVLKNTKVLQLNFDSNRISSIEDGAFDIIKNVKHPRIYLRNNTLTGWTSDMFNLNLNLRIRLKDNPINCDCNLDIPRGLKDTDADAHCAKPAQLAGRRVMELWGETLTCDNECELPVVINGKVLNDVQVLKHGDTLSLGCDPGYEFTTFPIIKCMSDGTYSSAIPQCTVEAKQPDPEELEDGSVVVLSRGVAVYPAYITTACPHGTVLKECACVEEYCSGVQLNSDESCTVVAALHYPTKARVTCMKQQDIRDAYTFSRYENVKHQAQCRVGYHMTACTTFIPNTTIANHATLIPDDRGICSVDCGMEECNLYIRCIAAIEKKSCEKFAIHKATVSPPMTPSSSFVAGDVVTISCEAGYSLYSDDGGDTVTCVEGFTYIPEYLPYCDETIVECTVNISAHVEVRPSWTVSPGTSVTVSCGKGYQGDVVTVRCGETGLFEEEPLVQCTEKEPVQCTLAALDRVVASPGWSVTEPTPITLSCSEEYKGDPVTVPCEEGYNTAPDITCRKRGNCQVGTFTNAAVTVGHNELLTEYFIIEDMSIKFQCDKGYKPRDPVYATCLPIGRLDTQLPKCQKDETESQGCSVPRVKHGEITEHEIGSTIAPGTPITVRCLKGYELQDDNFTVLKCISEQYYEPNYLPRCIEKDVSCEVPVLENGHYPGYRAGEHILKEEQLIPQCFTGYILTGPVIIVCEDGSFGEERNSCVTPDISCNIPIIKHGRVLHENIPFKPDTTFPIICDNGYWTDYPEITCIEAPNIYDPYIEPECQLPKDGCAIVAFPFMKPLFSAAVVAGETVTVECIGGYKLHGVNAITCGQDNQYVGQLPTCIPSSGCEIPTIEHGGTDSLLSHVENGTDVRMRCENGYDVYGDTILKCVGGTLSGLVTPRCVKYEDLDPDCYLPFPDNGMFIANNLLNPGSTLELVCDDGYEVQGGYNKIMCITEDTFEPHDLPQCSLSEVTSDSCIHLNVENGNFQAASEIKIGEKATISCHIGYTLIGPSVITCITRAIFDTTPYCEKESPKCDVPEIENGQVSPQQPIVEGQKYFVECDMGHDLDGDGTISCSSDGETIPPVQYYPTCTKAKAPCYKPEIENGWMIPPDDSRAYAVGEETHLVCYDNYQPKSGFKTQCVGDNTFRPPIPECTYVGPECASFIVGNGTIHPKRERIKPYDSLQVICDTNFEISGSPNLMCLSTGEFDSTIPKCSQVVHQCVIPFIANGAIVGPKPLQTDDRFSVECDDGFKIIGAKYLSCFRDEKYSDPLPTCQKIDPHAAECRRIVVQNGYHIGSRVAGHFIQVMCEEGYSIKGYNRLQCLSNGDYDKPTPQCVEKEIVVDMGCGTRDPGYIDPKLYGGEDTKPGEYPWNVLIEFSKGRFCGGAIINSEWVLTAGHCLSISHYQICDRDCKLMKTTDVLAIKAGVHARTNKNETWQIRTAVEMFTHPYFKMQRRYIDHDVGLIRVNASFTYDSSVNRICLPKQGVDDLVSNQDLFVVGWGKTNASLTSDTQQVIHVPYVDREVCNSNISYDGVITGTMFCAGFKRGRTDACQGDSGGPLVFLGSNGTFVQGGIVSWGNGCALENFYGVYTNLAYFYDWILGYVKEN